MTEPTQESAYDHLATKADVESISAEIERLRADIARWMRWLGVAVIGAFGVMMSVAVAFIKLA